MAGSPRSKKAGFLIFASNTDPPSLAPPQGPGHKMGISNRLEHAQFIPNGFSYLSDHQLNCIFLQLKLAILAFFCNYRRMSKASHRCKILGKDQLGAFFKALGGTKRMLIFDHFCKCSVKGQHEMNVNEVSNICDIDLSVVSRHLATLREAGVLTAEKKGKEMFYSLEAAKIAQMLRELADSIENCCKKPTDKES